MEEGESSVPVVGLQHNVSGNGRQPLPYVVKISDRHNTLTSFLHLALAF